jgi:CRP/FNR family transcriptional regulator
VKLFSEDEPCRGVFILCSGKAKITASRAGKPLMLRLAETGDILGLSAVFNSRNYEVTAEIVAPSVVRFVKREDFIGFVENSTEVLGRVMQILSTEYQQALETLRNLGLLNTATARVAQLLLNLCAEHHEGNGSDTARFLLTQQQIAQMTATTRETVTRLLMQLRRDRVISIRGSNLVIRDRHALERMAS